MRALQHLGHETIPFDLQTFYEGWVWARRVYYRLESGPPIWELNRRLLARAENAGRIDCVWIDKGVHVARRTLQQLRRICPEAKLFHYTPDVAFRVNRTRTFLNALAEYDLAITTKEREVEEYKRHGAREVIFIHQGYDPEIFYPRVLSGGDLAEHGVDVVLVARPEPHYVECVRTALSVTPRVAVWGNRGWQRVARKYPELKSVVRGREIIEAEYSRALQSAKICLGVLSRWAQDVSTTRSYEIPASGGFLLAERTEEHRQLFQEDEEAVFFDGFEELQSKIEQFLKNDEMRRRIARAGLARCRRDNYTYAGRFQRMFDSLSEQGILRKPANGLTVAGRQS
jgi:spore maturation protein CgeB